MNTHLLACLTTAIALGLSLNWARAEEGTGADPKRASVISGPFVHRNLAIFLIHGTSDPGPVPLTLQEALAKGVVEVRETGNVNQLEIENKGDEEIFVQSGDIVKGGRQDRVLTVSLILKGRSGPMPIGSFCVEQGRWSARGKENARQFESALAAVPSREAKIAMMAPAKPRGDAGGERTGQPARQEAGIYSAGHGDETSSRQQQVWADVKRTQDKLVGSLGTPVASPRSTTSLQLALENDTLKEAQEGYLKALRAAGDGGADVVGLAFAVNGTINSASLYPSNGLFRKMWGKSLNAAITEAIGETTADKGNTPFAHSGQVPTVEAVQAFLAQAEASKAESKSVNAEVSIRTRDGAKTLVVDAVRASGALIHRAYVAR